MGYILNRNESHQRYFQKQLSTETFRAKKVLNRMPKNLISQENQNSLKLLMNDYFAPTSQGLRSQTYEGDAVTSPSREATAQRAHSRSQHSGHFDSFKFGFDLPASTQLSRMSAKLSRWDRAQEMLSQRQLALE